MTSGTALLAALLFPIPIGAAMAAPEATSTKARLEVRAAPDCTSRADLAARVAVRTPRIQFVDEAAISAQVVLTTQRPGNVVAELVLAADGDKPSPRRVVARSCAGAAEAIALIIAVTLDPTLTLRPAPGLVRDQGAASDKGARSQAEANDGSDTKAERAASSEPPSDSASRPTNKPAERPDIAKPPQETVAVKSTAPSPQDAPTATRHGVAAYLTGQTLFGPVPAVMPGVAMYVLAAMDREGLWSPAFLLGALHARRSDLSELSGTASFALDAGSVDACPLRLGGSSLAARPCAALLVGRMASSGAGVDATASKARPFAVAGGAVVVTLGLGAIVELTGRLATGVTLVRDSYGFSPTVFHRAGLLTTSASLGIGIRWP